MYPSSPFARKFMKPGAVASWSRKIHLFGASLCLLPLALASAQAGATALGAYNVKLDQTSISGISSGAYMAVQFGVANSSIIKGVGVISGGPYRSEEHTSELQSRQYL